MASKDELRELRSRLMTPPRPREVALELVRENVPWRFTRSGLASRMWLKLAGVKEVACRRVVRELLDEGLLVEDRREDVKGRKVRLALPDLAEHSRTRACVATRKVPARLKSLKVQSW